MRHYRQKKKSRILRATARRSNPLKPKIFIKRLEELGSLGLGRNEAEELNRDLNEPNVDPVNATYVLDWWKARLSLLAFLNLPSETPENAKQLAIATNQLINTLQIYAKKYKLSAYDLALDGELQIDYWMDLQHFVQRSGSNPYFRDEWPSLHRVTAEKITSYGGDKEIFTWIGKLSKPNTKLSSNRRGPSGSYYDDDYREGDPAIKLLRGAYMGDPPNVDEETEIPKAAILSIEETSRPSDLIAFLKDAESSLITSTYFIPKYHQPFMTFPDGKVWTVISDEDKEDEKKSLNDCATGEYSNDNIIVISLREPVMTSPEGTFYRTRLRAEIVFPRYLAATGGILPYSRFSEGIGVINQLRGHSNSKPNKALHKYIMPVLVQPWVGHLTRPNYRPDEIFWLSDLPQNDLAQLKAANPQLFDAKAFYDRVKDLNFPPTLETKIMEGIEFPVSHVIQLLSEVEASEFQYYGRSPRSGIITRTLKRRLKEKVPGPELQQLLEAAENSLMRMGSGNIANVFQQEGMELSIPRIEEVLRYEGEGQHHLRSMALHSLKAKIERKEGGLEAVQELIRRILLNAQPYQGRYRIPEDLLGTGVTLHVSQLAQILRDYHASQGLGSTELDVDAGSRIQYLLDLAIDSLRKLSAQGDPGVESLKPLLESLVLDTQIPYSMVQKLLATNAIELSEVQIRDLLSRDNLLPGPTLAAFTSLKSRIDDLAQSFGIKPEEIYLAKSKVEGLHPKTLAIAQKAMLRLKDRGISEQAARWLGLPIRSIIKVLLEPVNQNIRNTAIIALRRKINTEGEKARNQAFNAVNQLLQRTKNKGFIKELFSIYKGHQHQYRLFHRFLLGQLDWLTQGRNRKFLLSLISESLPKSGNSYRYETAMPKPLYHFLRRMVADNVVEDNITFLLQIMFDTNFDKDSAKHVGALLEVILDVIIKEPKRLTADFCSWFQKHPGGWGTTLHKSFTNTIKLTPKLLRQFKSLLMITRNTGNDCYLDLAVTIGVRMDGSDRSKLKSLAVPLINASFHEGGHRVDYREFLNRLMPRRRKRMKRH